MGNKGMIIPFENLPDGPVERVWPSIVGSRLRDFGGSTTTSHFIGLGSLGVGLLSRKPDW